MNFFPVVNQKFTIEQSSKQNDITLQDQKTIPELNIKHVIIITEFIIKLQVFKFDCSETFL